MARGGAEILDDDEEIDLVAFMLEACGIDSSDFYFDEHVLTREIFENCMDPLLKMFENRSFRRASYFVIGFFFLITGARMPLGLKEDILEATSFEQERGYWLDKEFEREREIYINDFREKIQAQTYGVKLHTMGYRNSYGDFSKIVAGIHQFRDYCQSGKIYKVKHVNLDGWGLKSIPQEVFDLNELETLSLAHNYLTEIPKEISRLKSLKDLSLKYNQLNKLTEQALKSLGGLHSIEYLGLSHNYITSLPESIGVLLQHFSSLKILGLNFNSISTLPNSLKDYLKKKPSLEYIYLENNHISSLPESFQKPTILNYLCLRGNEIQKILDKL